MDNVRKPVVNPFSSDLPGDDDLLMFLSNNYLTGLLCPFLICFRVIVATNINPKMVGRQRHWSSIGRTTPERRTDSSFACVQCDNAHAVGALRYIVEMDIADDTAEVFLFERHTASHQTFTITRIFDERDRVPLPDFVDNLSLMGTIMMVATCQVIIQFLSGEAALNGGTDTNGDVSNKVANPASQVVKKARMA
ncbi:unnamed protein product [Brassica rapa subsp. trilocularis]